MVSASKKTSRREGKVMPYQTQMVVHRLAHLNEINFEMITLLPTFGKITSCFLYFTPRRELELTPTCDYKFI